MANTNMIDANVDLTETTPANVPATPTTTTPTPTPTKRTRASRIAVDAGVVGTAPNGYDALFTAVRTVNANTDMSVAALRADVKRVTREMVRIAGDAAMPPAGRGRWTGIRTYDGQNNIYALNDRAGNRVTDRTLCVMWAVEYPSNKCDFTTKSGYIASTRTDYVNGRHGTNTIDPKHRTAHAWTVDGTRA